MSDASTDQNVTDVVRILLAYRHEQQTHLVLGTGIPKRTLIRRMNGGGGWSAAEVALLARHFDVPVTTFYAGPDALMAGAGGRSTWNLSNLPQLVAA